jgi:hypothetical protein
MMLLTQSPRPRRRTAHTCLIAAVAVLAVAASVAAQQPPAPRTPWWNDPATVARMSDRVERMRAERNTRRTLMLLAMNKILTSHQRATLAARGKSLLAAPPSR